MNITYATKMQKEINKEEDYFCNDRDKAITIVKDCIKVIDAAEITPNKFIALNNLHGLLAMIAQADYYYITGQQDLASNLLDDIHKVIEIM